MEQLEQAVVTAFNTQTQTDEHTRALEAAQQLTMNQTCLTTCFNLFCQSQIVEVRMWSIGRITELLERYYPSLNEDDLLFLRSRLTAWIQLPQAQQEPAFIHRKFAQCYAMLVRMEYPQKWPTAFTDLLTIAQNGGATEVSLFTEIMREVDSTLIHVPTGSIGEQTNQTRIFKENLKNDCLQGIIVLWYNLLKTTYATHPQVANSIMTVVISYATWVDLDLIASKPFLMLLYSILRPPFNLPARTVTHDGPLPNELNNVPTNVFKIQMTSPEKVINEQLSVVVLLNEAGELPPLSDDWFSYAENLRCKVIFFLRTIIRRGSSPYAKLQLIVSLDIVGTISLFARVDWESFTFPSLENAEGSPSGFVRASEMLHAHMGSDDTPQLQLALAQLLSEVGCQIMASYGFLMSNGYTSLRSPFSTANHEEKIITDTAQLHAMVDSSLQLLQEWVSHFAFWYDHDDDDIADALQTSFNDLLQLIRQSQGPVQSPMNGGFAQTPSPPYSPSNSSIHHFNLIHPSNPLNYVSPQLEGLNALIPPLLSILTAKMAYPFDIACTATQSQLGSTTSGRGASLFSVSTPTGSPHTLRSPSSSGNVNALGTPMKQGAEDNDQDGIRLDEFLSFRRELTKTYAVLCSNFREIAQQHITERIQQALALMAECAVLHPQHVQPDEPGFIIACDCYSAIPAIELALLLFSEASGMFTEAEYGDPESFPSLVYKQLLENPFGQFPSPIVSSAFFELLAKFSKIPQQQPNLIQPLYQLLLQDGVGITNRTLSVAIRASRLFTQLTKQLLPSGHSIGFGGNRVGDARRQQNAQIMAPLINPLLSSINNILQNSSVQTQGDIDRLRDLFPTAGILIAALDPNTNNIDSLFGQILALPQKIIDSVSPVAPAQVESTPMNNNTNLSTVDLLSFALQSFSSVTKEINQSHTVRPFVQNRMLSVAQSVVSIVRATTSNRLRSKATTFLGTVGEMLGPNAGEALKAVVPVLLDGEYVDSDASYLPTRVFNDTLSLIKNFTHKFKADLSGCYVEIWPSIFNQIVSRFHSPIVIQGRDYAQAIVEKEMEQMAKMDGTAPASYRPQHHISEEEREHNQLLNTFSALFSTIAESGDLVLFLLNPNLQHTLIPTFTALTYAMIVPDLGKRVEMVQSFTKLVTNANFVATEGFNQVVISLIHPTMLEALRRPQAKQSDPTSLRLAENVAVFHVEAAKSVAGFGDYVVQQFLPTLQLSEEDKQMVLMATTEQNIPLLREFYRKFEAE
ncbi:putative tRNA exportin [Blattamonas nauphoetae]|uniref:Exportin-T n=1 Tax=Blattamonas nauphoetae TaxID=2049346 RepID=A0ABQ9XG12_9EUKA|nr:putative tRNA exportin [Blattamonas nauphoetae]